MIQYNAKFKKYILLSFIFSVCLTYPSCGTDNGDNEDEPTSQEFPIPWPEGGEIITDGREDGGTTGYLTIRYDSGKHEEVVEFYDDYASGSGWNRSELGQGEVPGINYMNLSAGYNISVGPPDDQIPDAFIITLTVS